MNQFLMKFFINPQSNQIPSVISNRHLYCFIVQKFFLTREREREREKKKEGQGGREGNKLEWNNSSHTM